MSDRRRRIGSVSELQFHIGTAQQCRVGINPVRAEFLFRHAACTASGMATVPASTRPPADKLALSQPVIAPAELSPKLPALELCHEQIILFTRRRMLDWKSQVTHTVVVAGGSALIFAAWKTLISLLL